MSTWHVSPSQSGGLSTLYFSAYSARFTNGVPGIQLLPLNIAREPFVFRHVSRLRSNPLVGALGACSGTCVCPALFTWFGRGPHLRTRISIQSEACTVSSGMARIPLSDVEISPYDVISCPVGQSTINPLLRYHGLQVCVGLHVRRDLYIIPVDTEDFLATSTMNTSVLRSAQMYNSHFWRMGKQGQH